ncbi:holo-ACP synthase [Conexibacter sp. W3-3-2]|uniref:Holo-[acyl-carrier-protein] synthase n=1 Tax=Paraconexibacter algicola TaxID=2133960 RepID=A0A2T4UF04_9ACTN|nr:MULTISPECIES: holo-ACP synthase [Solirubrobacterales]MTD47071.1 holo-ACP synthase [Conexibacter sp. W3-3-2]PTL56363.1 holo-ACP synthase [Paraconexibacter algicola]
MGVGIDLVEITRVEEALQRRPGLAQRLFTEAELAYADGTGRPGEHLAARFAAKEAVAKALALEAGWAWREVEVVADGGPPSIRLHGDVAARAGAQGVTAVQVSLTHARDTAGAVALTVPAA